jgi:hypothetical protein
MTEFTFPTDDTGLGISHMPGRKRVAPYSRVKNGYLPLAYFLSDDAAELALELLKKLSKAREMEAPDDERI